MRGELVRGARTLNSRRPGVGFKEKQNHLSGQTCGGLGGQRRDLESLDLEMRVEKLGPRRRSNGTIQNAKPRGGMGGRRGQGRTLRVTGSNERIFYSPGCCRTEYCSALGEMCGEDRVSAWVDRWCEPMVALDPGCG
jgi:hypothetical protein